ncbi:MAG: hypothetical protein H6562_08065 [Lewinellaceae bacterium]|nr:hypothetical protein [Lewinella sp.]MCB9278853.1 hypothetical protein [Lewinellaceae bacterium]
MENNYVMSSRLRTTLIGGIILGALCILLTILGDDEHLTRFWSNYLHNTVFFTGIGFISLFILAAFTTAYAGWYSSFKRVWEAYSLFLIPGLALLSVLVIGLLLNWHHLYHWANSADVANDEVLKGKSSFLNKGWYSIGTFVIVGIWIFVALKIRSLSLAEDQHGTADYNYHRAIRRWSAFFLPVAGFSSAAIIWQWVMSVDAHWYSTLFAWYTTASWFVSAMALTILTLIYLKSKGYFPNVTVNHFHDLGKYMFAFSVFWTYLWFSQYMLIWYGNVGEETVYFKHRYANYPVMFYGNLILNFVLPFLILMRNDSKRKTGILAFTSVLLLFGHWWDFFLMIKPGVRQTMMHMTGHAEHAGPAIEKYGFQMGFTLPGPLEVGTMLGFLSLFLWVVLSQLAKAPLVPANDPYLEESLHHHVWPEVEHEH